MADDEGTPRGTPVTNESVAAAVIALCALGAAAAAIAWLLFLATTDRFGIFPEDAEPSLYFSWRFFNWIAAGSGWIGKSLAAVFAVITYGTQFYAGLYKRLRTILAVAALCLVGVALSLVLMSEIDNGEDLNILRSFTSLTNEQMSLQIHVLLGGAVVWFGAFLATLLRISWKKPAGAIAKWLTGGGGGGGNGE
ncbi:hypothetical protein GRI89_17035 [Altererythrobacter salegens]|uniref:Uncharacterized protein n=1 Tax=Croceibacterium salegens TaxID=1737568 RepID=A0A6I4T3E0_9SPHN|nr:hypothetical protein [Croceibacterium salegens]MXO61252.1 hypothetical protein [Croceibacterium salegens]